MAGRSKEHEQKIEHATHPYASLEGSPVWDALDRALTHLVHNGDISELTARRYITGYLTKSLLTELSRPQGDRRQQRTRRGGQGAT